jgi:putative ABC transport system substrate-binding protein
VQTKVAEIFDAGELEKAIAAIPRDGKGGLVVVGEPFTNLHRARILDLATQHRLPTMCPYRFYTAGGCLISYGVDFSDQFRRTASYVNRVLKGDLPANLAVQSPVKFELVINLKTAKSLGLTVPPKLHFTADEVIE